MTTTPTPSATTSQPANSGNSYLDRYVESEHGANAQSIYDVNADLPDDFLRIGAVAMSDGLKLEQLGVRIFGENQKDNEVPLANLRLSEMTLAKQVEVLKVAGHYKAILYGRSRNTGMLRVHRFSLTAEHFRNVPNVASAASPVAASGRSAIEDLALRLVERQLAADPARDSMENAKKLLEFIKAAEPPAPSLSEDRIAQMIAAATKPAAKGVDWGALIFGVLDKLPVILAQLKPEPVRATEPAPEAKPVEQPSKRDDAEAIATLTKLIRIGVAAKAQPDAYAAVVADALRSAPAEVRDALLSMPPGSLADLMVATDAELGSSLGWLRALDEMVRVEFRTEAEQGGGGNE